MYYSRPKSKDHSTKKLRSIFPPVQPLSSFEIDMTFLKPILNCLMQKVPIRYPLLLKLLFGFSLVVCEEKDYNQLPVNTKMPEWTVSDWLNSPPLTLQQLQGQVILVRWWTGPTCPYCINSSAALNEFHESYQKEGLQVLGFYHHKSRLPFEIKSVKDHVEKLGFQFPVAVDHNWGTLNEWWLKDDRRKWTSVSFLLDRNGLLRYIHPGGQYVKGDGEYEELKAKIEILLKEEFP